MLIRRARLEDALAIGRVGVESWRSTYGGFVEPDVLAGLTYEARAERWRTDFVDEDIFTYVAVDEQEQVVGFAIGGPERTGSDEEFDGELYAIYLLESVQGQGLGSELVYYVANTLRIRGYSSLLVWVFVDNPFRVFYEKMGGEIVGQQEIPVGRTKHNEVAYGWDSLGTIEHHCMKRRTAHYQ